MGIINKKEDQLVAVILRTNEGIKPFICLVNMNDYDDDFFDYVGDYEYEIIDILIKHDIVSSSLNPRIYACRLIKPEFVNCKEDSIRVSFKTINDKVF